MPTLRNAITKLCHWYIERIDYGRPNVWGPMWSLYVRATHYIEGV